MFIFFCDFLCGHSLGMLDIAARLSFAPVQAGKEGS
jgi:hypothetical protein